MARFVHGGVPPLYIWDLFGCRCFQMLKLQPKFFLISINWRVAFQVQGGKRAGENLCIYSILGKLPWAAWISQIKVLNLNLYSLLPPPPNSTVPTFVLADKSRVKFPCCLAGVSSAVISSSGPWTSYKLGGFCSMRGVYEMPASGGLTCIPAPCLPTSSLPQNRKVGCRAAGCGAQPQHLSGLHQRDAQLLHCTGF